MVMVHLAALVCSSDPFEKLFKDKPVKSNF